MRTSVRYLCATILALCFSLPPAAFAADPIRGTLWDGNIYDQAAGTGAFRLFIYADSRGGSDGLFYARFRNGHRDNGGAIRDLMLTGSASASFVLDSDMSADCRYLVKAAIGADGKLAGTYAGAGACAGNSGRFLAIKAT